MKFKREDLVEVSNNEKHWLPAKYLAESFNKHYPHKAESLTKKQD